MVMIITVIIRLNPMVDSHRITKENECPPDQIWIIDIPEFFLPSYLERFEF
jgi:hypothetical protein